MSPGIERPAESSIDKETLRYLRLLGRSEEQIALVEAQPRSRDALHDDKTPEADYLSCSH
jgi:aconitate hydratase